MSKEVYWLALTVVLTGLIWVPYIINRILEHGLVPALHNPNRDERPKVPWANRMMYAHENAVENLVLFAPLVLMVEILQSSNAQTELACSIFFVARCAHLIIYTFGVPYFRTLAFFIGFVAQAVLVLNILLATSF